MRKKIDTIMLAVALFCISGAVLAYNLGTADGDIAVSLSELAGYRRESAISVYSQQAIAASEAFETEEAVEADNTPSAPLRTYELLPPIVTAPTE